MSTTAIVPRLPPSIFGAELLPRRSSMFELRRPPCHFIFEFLFRLRVTETTCNMSLYNNWLVFCLHCKPPSVHATMRVQLKKAQLPKGSVAKPPVYGQQPKTAELPI
jgi:hypothetical protein